MSHVHNIAGQSHAAAEYQAYLAALKAARQAREDEKIRKKAKTDPFQGYIDADEEAEKQMPQDSDQPPEEEPVDGADETDEAPGLGKHYA